MTQVTSSTVYANPPKFEDEIINDFIEWVRNAPLESDAVNNIPVILKQYDRRKTFWQRLHCLFL